MALTNPDWLTRRGGILRLHPDGASWWVVIEGRPLYMLRAIPAEGKFGSQVEETVNGKRLESKTVYSTAEEALRGGLEDLRKSLGW
jgi:hypothetical protein